MMKLFCLFVFQRTTVTHPQSVRQRNCWMWTRTLHKSKKLSVDSIIAELQSSVYRELNGIAFHGWAAPVAIMWRFAHIAYILLYVVSQSTQKAACWSLLKFNYYYFFQWQMFTAERWGSICFSFQINSTWDKFEMFQHSHTQLFK